MAPALVRVLESIDQRRWVPTYYLQARLSEGRPWILVTDGDSFWPHYSLAAAEKEGEHLARRLYRKRKRNS